MSAPKREVLDVPASASTSLLLQKEESPKQKLTFAPRKKPAFDLDAETALFSRIGNFLKEKPNPFAPIKGVAGGSSSSTARADGGKAQQGDAVEIIEHHDLSKAGGEDVLAKAFNLGKGPLNSSAPDGKALIEEVASTAAAPSAESSTAEESKAAGAAGAKKDGHVVFSDDEESASEEGEKQTVEELLAKKKELFKQLLGNLDPSDPRVQVASDSDDSSDEGGADEEGDDAEGAGGEETEQKHVEMEVGLGLFDVNGSVPSEHDLGASGIVDVVGGDKEDEGAAKAVLLPQR